MIYVLGMSHSMSVLKSASIKPLSFSYEDLATLLKHERFFDLPVHPGLTAGDLIKVYFISPGLGWGKVAQITEDANGQRQVAAVEGYLNVLRSIQAEQAGNVLVSFINGNEHSILSLVQHAQPFDFYEPEHPNAELIPDTQVIAYSTIYKQLEIALNGTLACLAMARIQLPNMRIQHVMPPPPVESQEEIRRTPEIFEAQISQYGLTPISLRVKYHRLACRILQEKLAPFGIDVIRPPSQAISASGGIKDEYAYATTHANQKYGALVLEQILVIENAQG